MWMMKGRWKELGRMMEMVMRRGTFVRLARYAPNVIGFEVRSRLRYHQEGGSEGKISVDEEQEALCGIKRGEQRSLWKMRVIWVDK